MPEGPLTDRQRELLTAIEQHIDEWGYPPTIDWLRRKMKVASKSTVVFHLRKLQDNGYIEIGEGPRALKVVPQ